MATRSTKSTTTKKTPKAATSTAKKTTVVKPKAVAPKTTAPKATVVTAAKPVVATGMIKKPELIDRIVTQTGMKKKDVNPVVEATLDVLAKALINGEELQVPPLGKVMINQMKDVANAKILKVKIRHPMNAGSSSPQSPTDAAE